MAKIDIHGAIKDINLNDGKSIMATINDGIAALKSLSEVHKTYQQTKKDTANTQADIDDRMTKETNRHIEKMAEIEDGKAKLESFAEDRKAWYSTFQTIVDSFRAEYEYYLSTGDVKDPTIASSLKDLRSVLLSLSKDLISAKPKN